MNGRCNKLSLDEGTIMNILRGSAREALTREGERLLAHMRREVRRTNHGGAPGKPGWREEIAANVQHVATAVSDDGVSMDFGYSPAGKADLVRAIIVEEGSGSAAGGDAIHAGPPGRSVWDKDMTGKHPSHAKTEYDLPDAFNQTGNQFVENAVRISQTAFGDATEALFASQSDAVFFGNVRVSE